MGASLSSPAIFSSVLLALPLLSLLAPPAYTLLLVMAFIVCGYNVYGLKKQLEGIPAEKQDYYRRLLGMTIIMGSGIGLAGLLSYVRVRGALMSDDGMTVLTGLWGGYKGFRLSFMAMLTIFLILYGFLQTREILTADSQNDVAGLSAVQELWLGYSAKGILGMITNMWMLTVVFMIISPAKIAANFPAAVQFAKQATGQP